MEQEKLRKKQNLQIVILSIIIIILLGVIAYLLFFSKKEDSLYTIIDGSKYQVYSYFDGKYEMFDDDVELSYPLFNGDDKSIEDLNNKIKKIFNGTQEKYEKEFQKGKPAFCTFCIKKNNEYYYHNEMIHPKYVISEDNKYLTIRISYFVGPACSSGYSEVEYYTISKEKNIVLTKEEVLEIFNVKEENIDKLLQNYVKNNHQEETVDVNMTLNNLKKKDYFIYKNNLYINYMVYDEFSYYETLLYNGKDLKKVSQDFKDIFEK